MSPDFWDDTSGKIRDEAKFTEFVNGNAAVAAAQRSREAKLPQKADEYQPVLPPDFKPPEGMTFELNKDDPLVARYKEFALEHKLDQAAFSKGLGLIAAQKIHDAQQLATAKANEVAKLGANASARVSAVMQWINAMGGAKAAGLTGLMTQFPIAGTIEAFEELMQRFSSQGVTSFSQSGRVPPPTDGKIPGYDKMTFEQRRAAQDNARRGATR